ncbi:MAG: alpha-hydroxy-acid oxidizing protein [Chloroflexi bacterium]|nr:alpha-hydroxy-acid oxidizing protein [Chloroflexota bacterium]
MNDTDAHHDFFNDPDLHRIDTSERGACALICAVRKGGQPTHGNVKRTIEALARMGHRTGYIEGEGDGVGILTDIPRELWAKWLVQHGLRGSLATDRGFWVGHLMIPYNDRPRAQTLVDRIVRMMTDAGLHVMYDQPGQVNRLVLGPNAEKHEPGFYQLAGLNGQVSLAQLDTSLFDLQNRIENDLGVHFASLSATSVVYKVQGTVEILRRYYPELRDPDYASTVTLGHARYSTNTNPVFERAQPFGLLGHNGEFNTISRFRIESGMLGVDLNPANSDSQDVDRFVHALCAKYGLDLIEAMMYVFPPYDHDLIADMPELKDMTDEIRRAFGPFAQGPAAVAARYNDLCVFSVDALGLRPLWVGETDKEYFASSERGVYTLDSMISNAKPMAPGEKIALRIKRGQPIEVLDMAAIQRHVLARHRERQPMRSAITDTGSWPVAGNGNGGGNGAFGGGNNGGGPTGTGSFAALKLETQTAVAVAEAAPAPFVPWNAAGYPVNTVSMSAMGWERYHLSVIETMAELKKEQVGALGWDGPLAAISHTRMNLSDYFKETVAVVTNPAIDREREAAQFTTRVIVGSRPGIGHTLREDELSVALQTPFVTGGHSVLGDIELQREAANKHGTMALEDLLAVFAEREQLAIIDMAAGAHEPIESALERIRAEAIEAVKNGARCILLDDTAVMTGLKHWIDPLLATATVDTALRETHHANRNLRRICGVILRSGALRDLHDIAMALSLGANAINPYMLYAVGLGVAPKAPREAITPDVIISLLDKLVGVMTKGVEKITSTIGCHELRGYGHSFSSIGLAKGVASQFDMPNYYGSEIRGLTWTDLKAWAEERAVDLRGETKAMLANPDRFYPKMWKKAEDVAHGEMTLEEYTSELMGLEEKQPVAIRHILKLKLSSKPVEAGNVSVRSGRHSMPAYISAMSFGSQGELAYKAYAEAAYRLDSFCVNGEGGELSDIMGKYPHHRGQQVASARFGVNIEFLNSCDLIEIKIGQGAKPGEGGHLPGFKVTEQVAAARHTVPGVDLISPSNNHDLYSIEDLAQLIEELKTANTRARISVKLPVVPGVGIIAVGVAKAGADVITITGYDGGTGAARAHALRHVGLPTEIGVWLAHRALTESGLREQVEIWADGGMKSGRDVIKMMCLGANRVGFGTLAMVAVGCTICRKCHEGTCHVGITTHIKTKEEAASKGIKSFEPREFDLAVDGIVRVFNMLAEDIKYWVGQMGFSDVNDLIGRADLIEQSDWHNRIDLTGLLKKVPLKKKVAPLSGGPRLTRPRNTLSKQITAVVADSVARGENEMTYDDEQVMAMDRALGTHLSGALKRHEFEGFDRINAVHLSFSNSAIPGNGLAAFMDAPMDVLVEGGAQDGVAKGARGGKVSILKGLNHNGLRLDGSVGKSFAYGAMGGQFIVQGNADTRACIRMSGADVVFGGEVTEPLRDELGALASRANLKGYACEYMTSGRVVILGDPGPWIGAGMTGGVIYQRIQPEMNLTIDAIKRRIAIGATIEVQPMDDNGCDELRELLGRYIQVLDNNNQSEATEHLYELLAHPEQHFVKLAPRGSR